MSLFDDMTAVVESRPEPSDAELRSLNKMLCRKQELEEDIAKQEQSLEKKKDQLLELTHKDIPEKMAELGMRGVEMADGSVVEIAVFYSGSLPKDPDERAAALTWMEENGHGDLISGTVALTFGKDHLVEARELAKQLRARHNWARGVDMDLTVHHSTLKAFCREQVEAGEVVPLGKLGVTTGQYVKTKKRR